VNLNTIYGSKLEKNVFRRYLYFKLSPFPVSTNVLCTSYIVSFSLQFSDSTSPQPNTPDITRTPYPAEAPENSGLVEASFLDVHIQSSGSGSFVTNEQVEQNDDTSFVDEDLVLSLSSSQREAGATRDSAVCKYSVCSMNICLINVLSLLAGCIYLPLFCH